MPTTRLSGRTCTIFKGFSVHTHTQIKFAIQKPRVFQDDSEAFAHRTVFRLSARYQRIPRRSTRNLPQTLNIKRTTFRTILKGNCHRFPYGIQVIITLNLTVFVLDNYETYLCDVF